MDDHPVLTAVWLIKFSDGTTRSTTASVTPELPHVVMATEGASTLNRLAQAAAEAHPALSVKNIVFWWLFG